MDPRSVKALEKRIILNYADLAEVVEVYRRLGWRVVATIGTFDMIHVGHSRYLQKAAELGDLLIVGTDSDRAVKSYKGPDRPIVPEQERLEMLLHLQYVSLATLVDDVDDEGSWQYGLLEAIRPDVFVAVEGSYPEEQLAEIRRYCEDVKVLPRQAETSTSETIRQLVISPSKRLAQQLHAIADGIANEEPA